MNNIPEDREAQLGKARNRMANLLTNYGKTVHQAKETLLQEGYDPEVVEKASQGAKADPRADTRADAKRNVGIGAFFFLAGVGLLMFGIHGFIIYGAIIFGGIWFVRALLRLND